MQAPAKYLVIIDAAGANEAILFSASRDRLADFDAGTEEVAVMTLHLHPHEGAGGPEWDKALAGRSPSERAGAVVYTLDV